MLQPSGSLLLMIGNVQEHYEHCLPLMDDKEDVNPQRISLTFRSIVPGYETFMKQQQSNNNNVASDLCCDGSP